jgi:myosin-crossreactive antigen
VPPRIRQDTRINSVRAAQMAVYELLGIDRKIPPETPHDK